VRRLTPAEELLQSLGITVPEEIDLEAIAYTQGVRIKYHPLDGCEARIIGAGDVAIVTVDNRSTFGRQRYSIGHELGHWKYHRGQKLVCRSSENEYLSDKVSSVEKHADCYAASLLMPAYLFLPMLRSYKRLNFDVVKSLAEAFKVSITAAAIRSVELGDTPVIALYHNPRGRAWFRRSELVPRKWFPRAELQPESSAMNALFNQAVAPMTTTRVRTISAEAWFDKYDAGIYEIQEQTFKVSSSEIITLLIIDDEEMLED
jgi:IrrE N-terminal-like domain